MRRNQNVESMEEVKDIIKNVLDESVNVTGFDLISRRISAMKSIKERSVSDMDYSLNNIIDDIGCEYREWTEAEEKGDFNYEKIEFLVKNNWRYNEYLESETNVQIVELLAKTIKF